MFQRDDIILSFKMAIELMITGHLTQIEIQ